MLEHRSRIPNWTNFSSFSNEWYSSNKTTSLPPQNVVIETWSQRWFSPKNFIMMGVFSTLNVSRSSLWTKDYFFDGNHTFNVFNSLNFNQISYLQSSLPGCPSSSSISNLEARMYFSDVTTLDSDHLPLLCLFQSLIFFTWTPCSWHKMMTSLGVRTKTYFELAQTLMPSQMTSRLVLCGTLNPYCHSFLNLLVSLQNWCFLMNMLLPSLMEQETIHDPWPDKRLLYGLEHEVSHFWRMIPLSAKYPSDCWCRLRLPTWISDEMKPSHSFLL